MTEAECESSLREFAEQNNMEKLGPVVHPTRIALTGKTSGPGLWQLMAVLGPQRIIHRIQKAKTLIPTQNGAVKS